LRRIVGAVGLPVAGSMAVVGAWWAAALLGLGSYLLPHPLDVAARMGELPGYLAQAARVTALEAGLGFAAAAGVGMVAGVLLASSRHVARALWPALVAAHATPKLALAPALVVACGFGPAPKVIVVALVCAFPVVLATATGLASTPAELVELTRSLDASWWQTMTKLRLPHALPHIFAGLKQAAPLAVIGAVIAELFGSVAGLGYTIRVAGPDTALTFAALVLLAAMSITLFYGVAAAERWLAPWVRHTTA
jgi:NitT/TauT family transport system permease protein